MAASKVNLNIIDPTNHPAANMRFFEIPVAGGLQVCSACPEMNDVFRDGEHLFYYQDSAGLRPLLQTLLGQESLCRTVAAAGQALALSRTHTGTGLNEFSRLWRSGAEPPCPASLNNHQICTY